MKTKRINLSDIFQGQIPYENRMMSTRGISVFSEWDSTKYHPLEKLIQNNVITGVNIGKIKITWFNVKKEKKLSRGYQLQINIKYQIKP